MINSITCTYKDANLSASKESESILCFLDCVCYSQYRAAFSDIALDKSKLGDLCTRDASQLSSFLISIVKDNESHKELLSNMLNRLYKKECLHLCIEKWKVKSEDPMGSRWPLYVHPMLQIPKF